MRRLTGLIAVVSIATFACGGSDTPASPETTLAAEATLAPETTTTAGGDTGLDEEAVSWSFVGADGVTSSIEDTSRIVTLSGDLTEAVFALGLGESVVAVDVTTVEPEAARSLPIVGVGRFLNAEAVLSEGPTLVIGDTQTSPLGAIEQIRSAGVPVVILDVPSSFEGLYTKIEAIGDVLGVGDAGTALAADVRTEVAATLAVAGGSAATPGIAFVYSRGPDVMLLFGAEMTTRPLIEAVGGVDVGAASGVTGTVPVTPEALIAAAPDVIVTTSEGLAALGGIDGLLATPGIAETPAGRSGAILDYPEGDILTFGPRISETLALFAEDLAELLSGQ